MRFVSFAILVFAAGLGCERSAPVSSVPRLPDGNAGKILRQAIGAAGGWEKWISIRDVAFVSTFTLYDPLGNVASETIGIHKSPLHGKPRARFESIGLPDRVTLGFDGRETWMLRDGKAIPNRSRLELARFNMVSDIFWFSLPFNLGEIPATIEDLGEEEDNDGRWQLLRVTLSADAPEAPGDWFILYIDARTGLIGRVFGHITASFLRHEYWMGRWLDYREWDGLRKERRRQFFPADPEGKIIGRLAAERMVEDVRFNNGFPDEIFEKPLAAGGGEIASKALPHHSMVTTTESEYAPPRTS